MVARKKNSLLVLIVFLLVLSVWWSDHKEKKHEQEKKEIHRYDDSILQVKADSLSYILSRYWILDSLLRKAKNDTIQKSKEIKHLNKVVNYQVHAIDSAKSALVRDIKRSVIKNKHKKLDRHDPFKD